MNKFRNKICSLHTFELADSDNVMLNNHAPSTYGAWGP